MRETDSIAIGRAAELACLLEVAAPKAGNVHPGASFSDVTWLDFVKSAHAIREPMEHARETGIGQVVLQAVRATREATGANTNLGIILLLAPLCACRPEPTRQGVADILGSLTARDAADVYEAICLAAPGGLGDADESDVCGDPPGDLVAAMALAADRDAVARQYANQFADVFDRLVPALTGWIERVKALDRAIIALHLEQMAHEPDSLILRKAGQAVADRARRMASAVLSADWPNGEKSASLFAELDDWLRADGNRRNPGTSADLVTAAIFVTLRQGVIAMPCRWSESPARWMDEPCAC